MKFILSESGDEVINIDFVKKIYAVQNDEHIGDPKIVYIEAELVGDSKEPYKDAGLFVTLATFDGDIEEENYKAAQAYLAELADELNGGAQ